MKELEQLRLQAAAITNLLHAGEDKPFEIPAAVFAQHIAILGKTGSGKTFTAKGFAERLLAQKKRVCVLDPTGVWWGLRSDITGKKPGFPIYVFGGEHADLPLDFRAGSGMADIIATTDTSAIIDTRELTVGERTRFFTDFAEQLLRRNKGALNLIIDEAHQFAPQARIPDPASGRMVHAANNLVSLGRGVGLRIMMISQRPAKLHKDSLTQAETLITLRLIAPQDVQAVKDWIGEWADPLQGRELISSLPSLPTGQGWIWAPELGMLQRLTFPRITTYDSSKAPDGSARDIVLASIDLASIEQRLQAVTKQVEESNPRKSRARIAEPEPEAAVERVITVERPIITPQDFERLEQSVASLKFLREPLDDIRDTMKLLANRVLNQTPASRPPILPDPVRLPVSISVKQSSGASLPPDLKSLKSGLRRMLIALAQAYPGTLTDKKMGLRADVSVKGGAFDTYLSRGRKSGWIEGDRSALTITQAGIDALGSFEPLPTGRALLDYWLNKLGNSGARRMLEVVARIYPNTVTPQQLGQYSGVSVNGGAFDTYLSRLRGFDLITGKRDALLASDEFFK